MPKVGPGGKATSTYLVDAEVSRDEWPDPIPFGDETAVCWSADGKRVISTTLHTEQRQPGKPIPATVREFDTVAKTSRKLSFPAGHIPQVVSSDGKMWRAAVMIEPPVTPPAERVSWLVMDGSEKVVPIPDGFVPNRPLADSRVYGHRHGKKGEPGTASILDLKTQEETPVKWPAELKGNERGGHCLSPDSTRQAVVWFEEVEKTADWPVKEACLAPRVGVCDLDGGNLKEVYRFDRRATKADLWKGLSGIEWR